MLGPPGKDSNYILQRLEQIFCYPNLQDLTL